MADPGCSLSQKMALKQLVNKAELYEHYGHRSHGHTDMFP